MSSRSRRANLQPEGVLQLARDIQLLSKGVLKERGVPEPSKVIVPAENSVLVVAIEVAADSRYASLS